MNELEYISGDLANQRDDRGHWNIRPLSTLNLATCINYNDIKPIPLTPEILKKNGWEHKDDVYFKEYPHRKLVVMDGNAYIINESCSLFLRKVEYVHQLQNLLFGLDIIHEMKV